MAKECILGHVILGLLQCQKAAVRVRQPVKIAVRHTATATGALLQEKEHAKVVLNITVVTSCFSSLSLQKETALPNWYKSQSAPWVEEDAFTYLHLHSLSCTKKDGLDKTCC